jgi:hypothetical protein
MDEPILRAWMQASIPPGTDHPEWPGRWVAEPAWPSPSIVPRTYYLNAPGALGDAAAPEMAVECQSPLATGIQSGNWCALGMVGDWAPDQREEDGRSVCFDTPPVNATMEILGFPEVKLTLTTDKPNALVFARLCDVAPDGSSLMVTRGALNLTHRDSHEHPEPLEPGRRYTVTVRLNSIAHSLPAGHRWRVALSTNYWTHLWPSPELAALSLHTGAGCRLALPVRAPRAEDADLRPFEPAEGSAHLEVETLRPESRHLDTERDLVTGLITVEDRIDTGLHRQIANGIEYEAVSLDRHTIVEGDPLSAAVRCERSITVGRTRGAWRTRVETVSTMSADAHTFHLSNVLDAYEGNGRVFTKTWNLSIPRDLV